VLAGYWSTYWYKGFIYGTEILRGLDVLSLPASEFLSENEIAAAKLADEGNIFNPQQQFSVTWPAVPVVARAYLDQLQRAGAISEDLSANVTEVLDQAEARLDRGASSRRMANRLNKLADALNGNSDHESGHHSRAGLAKTLSGIATRLRG
jgi:hypothetical protein